MKYTVKHGRIRHGGRIHGPGDVVDIKPKEATRLTDRGMIEVFKQDAPPKDPEPPKENSGKKK